MMISVPRRLKVAIAALLLSVPASAIHVSVMRQSHWWRLNTNQMLTICAPTLVLSLILCMLLFRGKRIALSIIAFCGIAWSFVGAWSAVRLNNASLGFF